MTDKLGEFEKKEAPKKEIEIKLPFSITKKGIARIVVLILIVIFSTSVMYHLTKPKLKIGAGYENVTNVTKQIRPNQPVYIIYNLSVEPGYGTNYIIIRGGIFQPKLNLTMKYFGSINNENYDIELPTVYKYPLINDILKIYNPDLEYFGLRNINLLKGISEPKNITIYIKAIWTPNQEELNKFRGGNVYGGTFIYGGSSPYGIFEYPVFFFGIIAIIGFSITVYNFLEKIFLED